MLLPSGNLFKCHEEVLFLQTMIPPKRFDIFSPLAEGCLLIGGIDAFRFFFIKLYTFLNLYFLLASFYTLSSQVKHIIASFAFVLVSLHGD